MIFILLAVSLGASAVGALCGIGGGIIIKPILDLLGAADIATISFLSGCTVLGMSSYSVLKNSRKPHSDPSSDSRLVMAIAAGAALGGSTGKLLFEAILRHFSSGAAVGAIQSAILCLITAATLLYIIYSSKIKTLNVKGLFPAFCIGCFMGMVSSFLGIGGGPINLMILYYFFSMSNASAIQSSLSIICISQGMNLLTALLTNSIPHFELPWLLVMISGGIAGGMIGRRIGGLLSDRQTSRALGAVMVLIIGISLANLISFI